MAHVARNKADAKLALNILKQMMAAGHAPTGVTMSKLVQAVAPSKLPQAHRLLQHALETLDPDAMAAMRPGTMAFLRQCVVQGVDKDFVKEVSGTITSMSVSGLDIDARIQLRAKGMRDSSKGADVDVDAWSSDSDDSDEEFNDDGLDDDDTASEVSDASTNDADLAKDKFWKEMSKDEQQVRVQPRTPCMILHCFVWGFLQGTTG
jgi:hypothetical protein